ncbi:MAG: HD domain-containing phosphohydrolase [Thermodesulfovibrionales bacterium]
MMKCWEVFHCKEKECPAYKSKDLRCWLFSGTHCREEIQGKFLEKMEMCLDCEVFKACKDVDAMRETIKVINKQLKEFGQIAYEGDKEIESMSMELAIGLSEVFEALKKIASGDPTVKIDETSEVELISRLKHIINQTAENIGEIVDQSHEFAMVLTEHFDVMHRVSKGDLNARVSGESQVELMESLKKLTNQMIDTISGEITERKKTEKKLQHAANEWRITFDSMPYGVMLLDREFNIIRTNNHISRLIGIPIEDVIGKKCYETIHGTDKPIESCLLIRSSKTLKTETFEYYEPRFNKYFMASSTPITDEEGLIKSYVHALIDITEMKIKEKELINSRDAFFSMLRDLDFSYKELEGLYSGIIHSFVNAIDAKSPWTKGHSERVTKYAVAIAQEIGLNEKDVETLRIAALLHDIGKIGTYDVILDKPDTLSPEEFELIKKHPVESVEILRPISQPQKFLPIPRTHHKREEILKPSSQLQHTLPIIRAHHERIDGKGYPDGLKGDEIPLLARIMSVADSYDSMTSDRPYRPSPGKEYAISELRRCSDIQFDPQVVEAFLSVLGNMEKKDIMSNNMS